MSVGASDDELEAFDGRHEQAVEAFDRVLGLVLACWSASQTRVKPKSEEMVKSIETQPHKK